MAKDLAVAILNQPFWSKYRQNHSNRCAAKFKVTVVNDGLYTLQLLEIADADSGCVEMPLDAVSSVTLRQIHLSLAYSTVFLPLEMPPEERRAMKPTGGGYFKVTLEDVIEIRKRHANGETYKKLSEEYGVTTANIRSIVSYRSWRNV
jgi:hypothetical protein